MSTAATRRGNFFTKDAVTALDSLKTEPKHVLADKDDQENIPNGVRNGASTAIPESYVGYCNIPNHVTLLIFINTL